MEIAKYAGKAATVGAVGYGAGSVMLPNTAIQLPRGRRIPFPMFAAGATAVGGIASDVMHDVVIPHILKSERWSDTAGAALAGGTSVGSMYAAAYLTEPALAGDLGLVNLVSLALAAEAGGSYLFHSFIEPLMA
jgi:hypothetical protein